MTLSFRPQFKCCLALGIEIKERIASEIIYVECVKIIVRVNHAFVEGINLFDVVTEQKIVVCYLNAVLKFVNIFVYFFNIFRSNLFEVFRFIKLGRGEVVVKIVFNIFPAVNCAEKVYLMVVKFRHGFFDTALNCVGLSFKN